MMDSASKTTVRKLIKGFRVAVEGEVQVRPDHQVNEGQAIEVLPSSKEKSKTSPKGTKGLKRVKHPPFKILLEDDNIIVVDKPAGLLSIATDKEKLKTLYRMVSDYVKASATEARLIFIVHRLDRDASGVMVFAKDEPSKRKLQKDWAGAEKIYHAVVEGHPKQAEGTIKNWLCENTARIVYVCNKEAKGAQEAVTHYKTIKSNGPHSLLEVRIESGRKHQIRVHMAHMDCPIVGDDIYGATKTQGKAIALHSHSLSFDHPVTGKRITIVSPLPTRFRGLV